MNDRVWRHFRRPGVLRSQHQNFKERNDLFNFLFRMAGRLRKRASSSILCEELIRDITAVKMLAFVLKKK